MGAANLPPARPSPPHGGGRRPELSGSSQLTPARCAAVTAVAGGVTKAPPLRGSSGTYLVSSRHVRTSPAKVPEPSSVSSGGCSITLPRANSNRLPHAGHSIGSGTAKLGGCPAALRLVPSYGHTTKFTYCRIRCITIMRSLPGRPLRAASGRSRGSTTLGAVPDRASTTP